MESQKTIGINDNISNDAIILKEMLKSAKVMLDKNTSTFGSIVFSTALITIIFVLLFIISIVYAKDAAQLQNEKLDFILNNMQFATDGQAPNYDSLRDPSFLYYALPVVMILCIIAIIWIHAKNTLRLNLLYSTAFDMIAFQHIRESQPYFSPLPNPNLVELTDIRIDPSSPKTV
jgi:flagellar biosynthesis/type III secretory pathway M-ring protein FliF/YscJ